MVPTLALVAALVHGPGDVETLAERFHRSAITATEAHAPDPPIALTGTRVLDEADGVVRLRVNGDLISVHRPSKRITLFVGSNGYSLDYLRERAQRRPRPRLSSAEAVRLLERYMRAADPGFEAARIRALAVEEGPLESVRIEAVPTHGGVPFVNARIVMELDPLYGRLTLLRYDPPPSPIEGTTPGLTPSAALERALIALESHHGVGVTSHLDPFELCYLKPEGITEGLDEWFSALELASGASGKAILVYGGYFEDRSRVDGQGIGLERFLVYLDVATGRPLALWRAKRVAGGAPLSALFSWDLGPASILLSDGALARTVHGSVDLVPPPPSFKADRKLGLTVGRLSVRAEYDAKQGLLRTKIGKGYRYGRPSKQVVRALAWHTVR